MFARLSFFNLGQFCQQSAAQEPDSNADANNIDDNGNLQSSFYFITSQWWNQINVD
tara:strand:+ start:426 stop:593 length:168 start_codon:yes stop_codon:yes gene_type:complete